MKLEDAAALSAYLDEEKVATVALPIDTDGTLHIATMNYSHATQPLRFYFVTSNQSEKCQLLNEAKELVAACNVGTYYGAPFTLQMRGTVRLIEKSDNPEIVAAYLAKRNTSNKNIEGETSVLLEFEPTWARFTDFSKGWDTTPLDLA